MTGSRPIVYGSTPSSSSGCSNMPLLSRSRDENPNSSNSDSCNNVKRQKTENHHGTDNQTESIQADSNHDDNVRQESKDPEFCSICHEELSLINSDPDSESRCFNSSQSESNNQFVALKAKCNHNFHKKCILNWKHKRMNRVNDNTGAIKFSDSCHCPLCKCDCLNLRECPNFFNDDKQVVARTVINDGLALEFTSDKLKDNSNIVMSAVKNDGLAVRFASDRLKDDYDIVMVAVKNNDLAIEFASNRLKADKFNDIVMVAARNNYINDLALELATDRLKDDYDVVLLVVENFDGLALEFASDRLKDNYNIVMSAIKNDGLALEFASDRLKGDPSIVMFAVRNNGLALEFASDRLKDIGFCMVLEAVINDGLALEFASETARCTENIVLAAVKNDRMALQFASDDLRRNEKILLATRLPFL